MGLLTNLRAMRNPQAKKVLSEVVPLLEELYPNQTPETRASILTLFTAAHRVDAPWTLDQPHLDVLTGTLRSFIALPSLAPHGPDWPGIDHECPGCRDFKAAILEVNTGFQVRRDDEDHVVLPITVEDHDARALPLSDDFKDWIIHGGGIDYLRRRLQERGQSGSGRRLE